MLNNTEHKSQTGNADANENATPRNDAAKVAERRVHRKFRQHRTAGLSGSGWRVTLW